MIARMVVKNIGIAPARFAMHILVPAQKNMLAPLRYEIATTVEGPENIEPGARATLQFEWPFDGMSPGSLRYKAPVATSLLFEILEFTVGNMKVLKEPGVLN